MNFQKMTKKQLEEYGRSVGIELDRRKTKKDLIAELKKAPAKKAPAKKAPAKKEPAKKEPAKKAPVVKKTNTDVPTLGFWDKLKKYFNL